jgi:hypothetical protein
MLLLIWKRNKTRWSEVRRAALRPHLRRLSIIGPYLIVLVLPGSFLMLPALLWLDWRRNHKRAEAVTPQK